MLVRKRDYLAVSYFVMRAFFLGVGLSFMYRASGKDSWISIILGYLIGNLFIYIYDKIAKKTNYNLNNYFNKKTLISKLYRVIFFIIYLFIILYASVIFTNFVKVYYLFDTPIWATLLLLFSVSLYGANKNEQTIIRTSFILFPLSLILILINMGLLTPLTNMINFLPVLTSSSANIYEGAIVFAACSALPSILLLEYKTTLKSKIISYSFVTLIILIINIYITGVLGEYLITTYSYPEYMVLRRIRFLDFIENVENFASIMWYFDAFIIVTLAIAKMKKLLPNKKENPIIIFILFIITVFSYIYFSNYFSALNLFLESGILTLSIFLIITGPLLYLAVTKSFKK